jgi:hypothetical protein
METHRRHRPRHGETRSRIRPGETPPAARSFFLVVVSRLLQRLRRACVPVCHTVVLDLSVSSAGATPVCSTNSRRSFSNHTAAKPNTPARSRCSPVALRLFLEQRATSLPSGPQYRGASREPPLRVPAVLLRLTVSDRHLLHPSASRPRLRRPPLRPGQASTKHSHPRSSAA